MTALGQVGAGARLTAPMVRAVAPLAAYKASAQTVTSSVTLINDSALFVPVLANAIYRFELFAAYVGGTQGSSDIKIAWTVPTGSVLVWEPTYLNTSGAAISNIVNGAAAVVSAGSNGGGNGRAVTGYGTFAVGSTPGNLQLQWAQNTVNATATQMNQGSLLALWQIQ